MWSVVCWCTPFYPREDNNYSGYIEYTGIWFVAQFESGMYAIECGAEL